MEEWKANNHWEEPQRDLLRRYISWKGKGKNPLSSEDQMEGLRLLRLYRREIGRRRRAKVSADPVKNKEFKEKEARRKRERRLKKKMEQKGMEKAIGVKVNSCVRDIKVLRTKMCSMNMCIVQETYLFPTEGALCSESIRQVVKLLQEKKMED